MAHFSGLLSILLAEQTACTHFRGLLLPYRPHHPLTPGGQRSDLIANLHLWAQALRDSIIGHHAGLFPPVSLRAYLLRLPLLEALSLDVLCYLCLLVPPSCQSYKQDLVSSAGASSSGILPLPNWGMGPVTPAHTPSQESR